MPVKDSIGVRSTVTMAVASMPVKDLPLQLRPSQLSHAQPSLENQTNTLFLGFGFGYLSFHPYAASFEADLSRAELSYFEFWKRAGVQ